MANYVNYIREKITKFLPRNRKTILVLKGIPIRLYNPDFKVNVGEILKNKFAYFAEIINNDRNVITYDEFLALYEFITAQYTNIIVLVNNLFINYFPLEVDISEADLRSLLIHYNAIEETGEEENEEELEDLSEITKIYANIKVINGNYYVVYNNILPTEKEQEFYLFDGEDINTIHLEKEEISFSGKYYKITSEEDYLLLVDDVYKRKYNRVYVLDEDPLFMEVFLQKIRILKYIFPYVTIKLGVIREGEAKIDVRQEFFDILKKYWGYSNFKTLKVYDINSLHNKQKIVKEVSQGEIIARIVEEVEKCYTNQNYRDIFVTAPTGSGKSIMFQIPAIYLAEKYELFTIVISPLIGLMKDQVSNLEMRNYTYARTINSDISPIKKQEIINDIIDKKCHILYLSPESLLSKSDLDQIIGNRKLGLLVVDEAHIVTTWGKQFRQDYWYLGDHLSKVKKAQLEKKDWDL